MSLIIRCLMVCQVWVRAESCRLLTRLINWAANLVFQNGVKSANGKAVLTLDVHRATSTESPFQTNYFTELPSGERLIRATPRPIVDATRISILLLHVLTLEVLHLIFEDAAHFLIWSKRHALRAESIFGNIFKSATT